MYAYGLRRTKTSKLDVVDLRRNRSAPRFGRCGRVQVRFGKASKGSPPKRWSVLLVPEMDWIVDALEFWLGEVRPRFSPGSHPALWITERVGRSAQRSINEAFVAAQNRSGNSTERIPSAPTNLRGMVVRAGAAGAVRANGPGGVFYCCYGVTMLEHGSAWTGMSSQTLNLWTLPKVALPQPPPLLS